MFGDALDFLYLVQPAAADDTNRWNLVTHMDCDLRHELRQLSRISQGVEPTMDQEMRAPCLGRPLPDMYCSGSSMPKFFIKTYGCQMNERDSEQVAHSLIARGYERVAREAEADVVLLNTCSVRDMADQKALGKMGMLGRMAKERPHVVFGFLGCMAQARGGELLKRLPHVDLVVGTQKFHLVADYVDELVARKRRISENAQRSTPNAQRSMERQMDDLRFSNCRFRTGFFSDIHNRKP